MKYLFVGAAVLIFGFQIYWAQAQYFLWLSVGPPAQYLLPPYQQISYFFQYSFHQFFLKYVISLGAALLFLVIAKLLNRRFQKRFFEEGEPYLGALAIFVLGHPLWLYEVPTVLGLGLLGAAYNFLTRKRERFPLCHFWIPAAILIYLTAIIVR